MAVSDDPEGAAVLKRTHEQWMAFPKHLRGRIHLALLPMDDPQENAAMVNALQRSVSGLLNDPAAASAMGAAAARRVRDHFLAPDSLLAYFELLCQLLGPQPTTVTMAAKATDMVTPRSRELSTQPRPRTGDCDG